MEITEFFQDIKMPTTVVHVIGVVFGMGGALLSDLLFSFFSKDRKLNATEIFTLSILARVVFYSLVVIVLSGIGLFLSDIEKYATSAKFLSKMTILGVLLVNGYFLNTYIWSHLLKKKFFNLKKERNTRRLAFACGAVSVVSWLSVCILGVVDSLPMSYPSIVALYILATLFAVSISLIVEKRKLD